jgi:hypothetical protein
MFFYEGYGFSFIVFGFVADMNVFFLGAGIFFNGGFGPLLCGMEKTFSCSICL